ncbi:hypothetical protein M514_28591 [Trichuris suis]|uniref:Uncharacterized protein n=1 Tax=Trichuris suis TaxID=68888 RepID=A0A085MPT3_9BILA|nr:hypothetical protein M514_28591 [Trichuris suis]
MELTAWVKDSQFHHVEDHPAPHTGTRRINGPGSSGFNSSTACSTLHRPTTCEGALQRKPAYNQEDGGPLNQIQFKYQQGQWDGSQ